MRAGALSFAESKLHLKNDAPNTTLIYRKNIENNQGLLQALEKFGKELRKKQGRECKKGTGREISYIKKGSKIKIYSVAVCRKGKHEIAESGKELKKMKTIPKKLVQPLRRLGAKLIDDKSAACNTSGFNKNAARRIEGTYTPPNVYTIKSVGRCHNSPTCYVDVDMLTIRGTRDACISPYTRRNL